MSSQPTEDKTQFNHIPNIPYRYSAQNNNYQNNLSKIMMRFSKNKINLNKKPISADHQYQHLIIISTINKHLSQSVEAINSHGNQSTKHKFNLMTQLEPPHSKISQSKIKAKMSKHQESTHLNANHSTSTQRQKSEEMPQTNLIHSLTSNDQILRKMQKIEKRLIVLPELQHSKKKLPMLMRDAQELKHIKSESYIIVEYPSERTVVSFQASNPMQIASLTKIMTCLVVLQLAQVKQIDLSSEKVTISAETMQVTGTSAELIEGEQYSIEQLLFALMLPSGNDAALELAAWAGAKFNHAEDHFKGKVKAFIQQMNKTSFDLSLRNTKFANPHGLPHQQAKSTAFDLAKLCLLCMKDPFFRQIVSTQKYKVNVKNNLSGESRQVEWENTNKLLRRERFTGLKTGITVTAGPCLATAFEFKERTYLTIILRAPKISGRFKETRLLLFWALSKLYAKDANQEDKKVLRQLRKKNAELDSDNSDDEHEFKYDRSSVAQYKKRCNILDYEL